MKVLLINPPRSQYNSILKYATDEAKKYIHKKLIGPPLGLLTVASLLDEHELTFLEMKGEYDLNPNTPDVETLTQKYLDKTNPDIVGITLITSEFNAGMKIFDKVKEFNPNIVTVAGGLHTTLCPNDFINTNTDIVAPGYCSHFAFRDIVNCIENGDSFDSVGGILINENGKLRQSKAKPIICDPAKKDFVLPKRGLLKRWLNTYIVGKAKGPSTYLFSSLGCPYRCSFCSIWPQMGGKYLTRNIESIIEELRTLDDYEVVRFADANTIVDIEFISKLFDRIEEEGIKKKYVMDIRVDTTIKHPKLIEKLAKNGLIVVISGFESYRKKELKRYNKEYYDAKAIEEAINIFHNNGIMIRGNYVIPSDYDLDDFKAMSDYANSHKVTYAGYTILTPMPGTPYFDEMKENIIDLDYDKYNFFNCVLNTKLPIETFYENVSNLWLIKKGTDVI